MRTRKDWVIAIFILVSFCWSSNVQPQGGKRKNPPKFQDSTPILWRNPGNIRSRNLFYGPGSSELAPAPPFRFLSEDRTGGSPKFEVEDARGVNWKVKLGPEAQAETVATRIIWSVGYFAEEAYYFNRVQILNLPRLTRGKQFVLGREVVVGARFEPRRKSVKRGPSWHWAKNPFSKTRELDGLRVMMILLNNWDLKDSNNTVLYVPNPGGKPAEAQYTVTDLGATLGRVGGVGGGRSKNDLKGFSKTRFVRGTDHGTVKFDYHIVPSKLGLFTMFYPPYFFGQVKKQKLAGGISVENAAWIGSLLSQLSDGQLRDGFRAAGDDRATSDAYVRIIRARIDQLARLSLAQTRVRKVGR
jgi:hypothetical protein